jgi:hypothetical protein
MDDKTNELAFTPGSGEQISFQFLITTIVRDFSWPHGVSYE